MLRWVDIPVCMSLENEGRNRLKKQWGEGQDENYGEAEKQRENGGESIWLVAD